ncbi:candidapepsin-8 [[Candida] jaroonii]|uniref:Candidapepsin-8 n=1 Tax=[Candida] jaroonii TaxID=467808 RepID=A0ACA9YDD3_9ASCO|nr:candidapepsin-8 [[Candida] jaroonii]
MALFWLLKHSDGSVLPGGFQKRGDKIIKLDFNATAGVSNRFPADELDKRASGAVRYPLENQGMNYFADIWVGSNGEKISVDLDTGSSDLWVIDSATGLNAPYGSYDRSRSSTYRYIAPGFSITYGGGATTSGDWVSDRVSLSQDGSVTIPDLQFADATQASIPYGIFGIGLRALEDADTKYDNLPAALKKYGYIAKNAYSLYLNSKDAASGSVLFGGIDHAKYSGNLVTLPITSAYSLDVEVKRLSIGGYAINTAASATLDSGTSLSYLHPDIVAPLANSLGLKYQDGSSPFYYWDSCEQAQDLVISFNGVDITVPKEYIAGQMQNPDGSNAPSCAFLIYPETRFNILGDNFLRNAYVVYDLDDMQISLAPVRYNTEEQISVIS